MINFEKSIFKPVKILTWLGIQVNLIQNFFSIPAERIGRIISLIDKINESVYVSARSLASLAGAIISCKFVLGNINRLKTRSFYKLIEARSQWDTKVNRFNSVTLLRKI